MTSLAPTVRLHDLAERVALLGLEEDEALVYVWLHRSGAIKPGDLAQHMKRHRSEVYRRLQSLTQKGYAEAMLGKPIMYRAVPINTVKERFLTQMSARAESMKTLLTEIEPFLNVVRVFDHNGPSPTARIVAGRRDVARMLIDMLTVAEHEILIMSTRREGAPIMRMTGVMDTFHRRVMEGVQTRLLLGPGHEALRHGMIPTPDMSAVRILEMDFPYVAYIRDGVEALVCLSLDKTPRLDSDHEAFLQTNAVEFVQMQVHCFNELWRGAQSVSVPPLS